MMGSCAFQNNIVFYCMKYQYQNDDSLTPWGWADQNQPSNFIQLNRNQYRQKKNENGNGKKVHFKLRQKFNLRKEDLRNSIIRKKSERYQDKEAFGIEQMIKTEAGETTTMIQDKIRKSGPVELSELFPAYGLQKMNKGRTFYRPLRFHTSEERQLMEDISKIQLHESHTHPLLSQQNRKYSRSISNTSKMVHNFSITKKGINRHGKKWTEKTLRCSAQDEEQGPKVVVVHKKLGKFDRFQQILQSIERKDRSICLKQPMKKEPAELNICLESKKNFYLNLPKIQFIQIYH